MKREFLHLTVGGLLLLMSGIATAEAELPAVEFSGFADIQWWIEDGPGEGEDFAIGQAELDLAASLSDKVNLEMALAYDPDLGGFGLGALVMDLSLVGSDENSFHQSGTIENAGIIIGQMDVPFGIDWLFYPSISRQFITGPLAVASTHDGWNDLGGALYFETAIFNAIFYRLNGTGYAAPYLPEGEPDVEIGSAGGGRLGITPLAAVEIGGSFASIVNIDGEQTSSLLGLDAQWAAGSFSAKGEYITQKVAQDSATELEHTGLYVEGMYHPGGYFLLARYGQFTPEGDTFMQETRLCIGAGYVLEPGAELRIEQQFGIDEMPDLTVAQLVIGF